MKSLLKVTLVSAAIVFALAGCDDKKDNTTLDNNVVDTFSTAQKESYAMGVSFGDFFNSQTGQIKTNFDKNQIIKGFEDSLKGQSKLSEEEIRTVLTDFGKRLQEEAKVRLDANKKAGDEFREEFAKQDGVKKTESGLLYQIIEEGSDQHPKEKDEVVVHYKGTLIDGQQFDSSYDRGETTKFPLNGVIKGWQEGIQLIGVGGKIKLVVPPELAYGDEQDKPGHDGNVGIPAGSTLVFEVDLLGVDPAITSSDTDANTEADAK
ncbi:FKBP-type peptidyl-prolyl cis-trans isomerase [Orbaceae bacterium ac157xtp]